MSVSPVAAGGNHVKGVFGETAAALVSSYSAIHGRPSPQLTGLALIHGYSTAFWCSAAILTCGAIVAATLLRSGPLTWPGQHAGFLGPKHDPWQVRQDPNRPGFGFEGLALPAGVSVERLYYHNPNKLRAVWYVGRKAA